MSARNGNPVAKLGMAAAMAQAERIEGWLSAIHEELKLSRLYQTQRRFFTLPMGGTANVGTTEFQLERIAAGQTFVVTRLVCFAPPGSQLELYENSVQANNFLEVVTNVQRYANSVPGTMVIEGPSQIVAVNSKATEEGPFSLTLSGLLVPTQALDTLHPRTSVHQ